MRNWDNSWEDITIEFNEESATIEGYYNALSYSYLEVYWNESDSADNIFDAIKGGVIVVYGEMYRERMDEMFNK
jgi:hypothetical protein